MRASIFPPQNLIANAQGQPKLRLCEVTLSTAFLFRLQTWKSVTDDVIGLSLSQDCESLSKALNRAFSFSLKDDNGHFKYGKTVLRVLEVSGRSCFVKADRSDIQ